MKFLVEKIKEHWPFFIIIGTALVVYSRWLNFSVFNHSDWWFKYSEGLRELAIPTVWRVLNFGQADVLLWKFPHSLSLGIFGWMGFDLNVTEKFIVFWPIAFLLPIAGYLLVKEITGSKMGGIIGSLVLSYNTYFLAIDTQGHLLITLASVFGVFAVWAFIKMIKTQRFYWVLVTALLLLQSGSLDFRMAYLTLWIMFFYLIFTIVLDWRAGKKNIAKPITFSAIMVGIFGLLNAFWLFAYKALSFFSSNNEALGRGLFGDEFWDLSYAMTLFHPFWSGGYIKWFALNSIPFYFWLIPIFAVLGFYLNRKNKDILFFMFVAILGIFLAKQADMPFASAYGWLYDHIPGFNAFREATKFYYFIAIGYAVLIGSFVGYIWEHWSRNKLGKISTYLLTGLISVLFLWNAVPMVNGKIKTMFLAEKIDPEYIALKDYLSAQPEFFRMLWVPQASDYSWNSNNQPRLGISEIKNITWKSLQPEGVDRTLTEEMDILRAEYGNKLIDQTSIKYVIVPIKSDDRTFFFESMALYDEELGKLDYLKKIDIGLKKISIYENTDYRPHVYLTSEQDSVYLSNNYIGVESAMISPSEYGFELKNINEPVYLNFSENYHPDWQLVVGDFSWIDVILDKHAVLPDDNHFQNDANLNSFLIGPEDANAKMTIYFRPQAYLYAGMIISIMTLILCLGYLGWCLIGVIRRSRQSI